MIGAMCGGRDDGTPDGHTANDRIAAIMPSHIREDR
jgi:hypothetical protein